MERSIYCGESCGSQRLQSKNEIHTSNKDDATIAVAGVIHQDTDPELGEVPDLKRSNEVKIYLNTSNILKDLIWRHPNIFTDMAGETGVVQDRVKLKDNTPIRCKPYPLRYAKREELRNQVDSMLEVGEIRPSASPIVMVKKKDGLNRVCVDFRKLSRSCTVAGERMKVVPSKLQK